MQAVTGTGRVLAGRYQLLHQIGQGAMGTVWRARDSVLTRDVAVKELRLPALMTDEERQILRERTLREARAAGRLNNPGVITIYDVIETEESPWIVMELVSARSLDQVLAEDGPLPPRQAAEMGIMLLSALADAHAAGIVHRDVKPANVLLIPGGRAVLTDFGIATQDGDAALTQAGMVMGTPGFCSPERIRGEAASPASDLWSLGATLYAAVEGRGPFEGLGSPMAVLASIVNSDAPAARSAGPLTAVIGALLARDPARRASATTAGRMLAAAAEEAVGGSPAIPGDGRAPGGTAILGNTALGNTALGNTALGNTVLGAADALGYLPGPAGVPPGVPPGCSPGQFSPGQPGPAPPGPGQFSPGQFSPGQFSPEQPGPAGEPGYAAGAGAPGAPAYPAGPNAGEPAYPAGWNTAGGAGYNAGDAPGYAAMSASSPAGYGPGAASPPGYPDTAGPSLAGYGPDLAAGVPGGYTSPGGNGAAGHASGLAADVTEYGAPLGYGASPGADDAPVDPPDSDTMDMPWSAGDLDAPAAPGPAGLTPGGMAPGGAPPGSPGMPAVTSHPGAGVAAQEQAAAAVSWSWPPHEATAIPAPPAGAPGPGNPPGPGQQGPGHPGPGHLGPGGAAGASGYPPGPGYPPPGTGYRRSAAYQHAPAANGQSPRSPHPPAGTWSPGPASHRGAGYRAAGARLPQRRTILLIAAAGAAIIGVGLLIGVLVSRAAQQSTAGQNPSTPGSGGTAAGSHWYTVPASATGTTAGFSLAAPGGWQESRQGSVTYLRNPATGAAITITLAPFRAAGPLAEAQLLERQAARLGSLPGYHQIAISPFVLHGAAAAVWRFAYRQPGYGSTQALEVAVRLNTTAGPQAYELEVAAPTARWPASRIAFNQVLRTFTPRA